MVKKVVHDQQTMPRFYGVAYSDTYSFGFVCYPIPLNLVMRFIFRRRVDLYSKLSHWRDRNTPFTGLLDWLRDRLFYYEDENPRSNEAKAGRLKNPIKFYSHDGK